VDIECLCAGILFADVGCHPIARVPEEGELVVTDRVQLGLGGCASNAALDLARVGVKVGVSGCVGEDTFGRFIVDALVAGRVDISGVHRLDGVHSACTMIVNVEGQDRRFISTPGANSRFTVEHIPDEALQRAKVLYVGGYLMMKSLEGPGLVELFRRARAGGAKTVLDVVLLGGPEQYAALESLLPETDVFLPNNDEAAVLSGRKEPMEQAEFFRQAGAKTVVITCGSEGSVMIGEGLRVRAGVYPIEFVGGTGSGDAFDAGFVAGMLAGEDLRGCLRWGSALGASCVRAIGATDSVFTREEALQFMAEHELPMEEI
jgi:sugar/nucleoside kinase (ribokinase family)